MGLFQSKTGHCEICGIQFAYEGAVCPRKCTGCRYKERERQNDKALKCSLCHSIFASEVYVEPHLRSSVRCNPCADMMRGHLQEMDYKEIKLDNSIYVYPTSMEEDIRQHHAKGETNKKSLPKAKN